jgi:hypothetical protein
MPSQLAQSVLNDPATYKRRLEIARSEVSLATRYQQFATLVCAKADSEKAWFGIPYTMATLSLATEEVLRTMMLHIAEFNS